MTITHPAPDVHVQTVTGVDPNRVEWTRTVVWADRAADACPGCGEPVGHEVDVAPALVDWRTPDAPWEARDTRHVHCGMPLSGASRTIEWTGGVDESEIAAVVAELAAELAADIETERDRVRRALRAQLDEAAARLAEPLDDDETLDDREHDVLRGTDVEPGVLREHGALLAWAHDPAGRDEEGVVVRETDPA